MIISDLIGRITRPARFESKPLERATIEKILESARLAPSANNSQIWRFFVITGADLLRETAATCGVQSFKTAPVIIAACADPWIVESRGHEQPFFMIDIPIAISHIVLMARQLEIDVSVSFDFNETALKSLLDVPKDYRAVALIGLGYAREYMHFEKSDVADRVMII